MTNEMHSENRDRIDSDYENLGAASEKAFEYLHRVSNERLCFPALTNVVDQLIDVIREENMGLMFQNQSGQITLLESGEMMDELMAIKLLEMYFIGHEMGKHNIDVWTHVILDAATEEAERLLEKGRKDGWPEA